MKHRLILAILITLILTGCAKVLPEAETPPVVEVESPPTEMIEQRPQYCGQNADPDDAIILTDEEALDELTLVNRCQRLSSTFVPFDLTPVSVPSVNISEGDHHLLRDTAARALETMFEAAEAQGISLLLSSAYRSYELQQYFHEIYIAQRGLEEARRISAVPGHSEHQLGLAVDVTIAELAELGWLHTDFAETIAGIWVKNNASKYGYLISFPENREAETGYLYEPWHLRYVGIEAATAMDEKQQILEEFLWYKNNGVVEND